jgi:hypothetical protein
MDRDIQLRRLTRICRLFGLILLSQAYTPCLYAKWETAVFGELLGGPISGYAQTPRGGDFGTTSFERPTFREVGEKNDWLYQVGARVKNCGYFSEFLYKHIHVSGDTLLQQDLITHQQYIPQNAPFQMQVRYDWYEVKLGKDFQAYTGWTITPFVSADFLKYHYAFSSINKQSSRGFNLLEANVGLKLAYALSSVWTLDFEAAQSLPLSHLTLTQAAFNLRFYQPFKQCTLVPNAGISFIRIDYEDEQPVPNHIYYRALPAATIGLSLIF